MLMFPYLDDVVGHSTDEAAVLPRWLLPFTPQLLCLPQHLVDVRGQLTLNPQQHAAVTSDTHRWSHVHILSICDENI